MKTTSEAATGLHLRLEAQTAEDMMVRHVVGINQDWTVQEAAELLTERGISGAPVLDESGRAIGVVTRADIVAHNSGPVQFLSGLKVRPSNVRLQAVKVEPETTPAADAPEKRVRDIMNPVVFSVSRDTPARSVVDAMLCLGVHRLFVTDATDKVLGVISTLDILRRLHGEPGSAADPG
jgi:predicted transcriptional regulator